jgi:hypothetical protein
MSAIKNITQIFSGKVVCLVPLFIFCHSLSVFSQDKISIIGNFKGVPETMKIKEVVSVLKGEKQRWGDGTKIVIALMKTSTPVGNTTSKKIYNMTGDELNKYWLALVFQGKSQAPSFFNSVAELENFVAQTPGAIGVVEHAASEQTRTVAVDGKKTF